MPIQKITVFEKNDAYMRGFRIHYRNGSSEVINSADGTEAGTINFNEGDTLVGINVVCTSGDDKRPRKLGFTLMRGGQPFETPTEGCNFGSKHSWPETNSLQGQSAANKRIK